MVEPQPKLLVNFGVKMSLDDARRIKTVARMLRWSNAEVIRELVKQCLPRLEARSKAWTESEGSR